ncbi:trypsin-like serine protease [Streptomyces sp. VRA16 Mangrove soil]|uniref:S1 family peptidase n=1 Tax=Streptomyces sp. VRA16 Mangrove soil TaxID=2817434 RepID=UPI001A9FF12A|nr:trypsin-like serine protease [Streptomyces sp. VRA16 Mangrove soil]MBO1334326.1 trypsin-like serine protease [Streptomyces sp. VRA16 Mangrove soil]
MRTTASKLRRVGATALALLALSATALVTAGPSAAVIGGTRSTYGPWAVRMLVDGKPECTATAVSRRWIISASHCFFEQAEPIADRRITFRVGALDMRRGTVVRPVPGRRVGSGVADMMLVKVDPMTVRVARLATAPARPGTVLRQSGWGATCTDDENRCQSPVLRQSTLRVLKPDDPRCEGYATADGSDFCLGKVVGIPAGGDSGGPVTTLGPRGTETLVGVFDASDRESVAGAGDVSRQLSWIRSVIRR